MRPEGYPRDLRLRRRAEFLRVQRTGLKHHVRSFLVFVAPNPRCPPASLEASDDNPRSRECRRLLSKDLGLRLPPVRLGVTVTRKVGGAVVRNRIKRLVREAFRRERENFQPGYDMVWVAKRGADTVCFDEVVEDMQGLARRLSQTARTLPTRSEA